MIRSCSHVTAGLAAIAAMTFLLSAPGCERAEKPAGPQGQQEQPKASETAMNITSKAFADGQPMPRQYTGFGRDISPPLAWSNLPEGTKELALIVNDPDSSGPRPWVHWVIYNMPPTPAELPEGLSARGIKGEARGMTEGVNSWGNVGYQGPTPPSGTHRYRFRLIALDAKMELAPGLTDEALLRAVADHIVGEATLTGTCKK